MSRKKTVQNKNTKFVINFGYCYLNSNHKYGSLCLALKFDSINQAQKYITENQLDNKGIKIIKEEFLD